MTTALRRKQSGISQYTLQLATDEQQLFETAFVATIKELDLAFPLIEEQKTALKAFLCKNDVFAVLPTGYGKSLIYRIAPVVA